MARIRSIHPGLFTDETFVALSTAAQILWIGLWCEADDQGVFEWKPAMLKMRILPASTTDIVPLLAELERADCIKSYKHDGRDYGVVRNFVKHQRPKSPKIVHALPPRLQNYAGFKADGRRPDATTGRRRFGTGSERDTRSGEREFVTSSELESNEDGSDSEVASDDGDETSDNGGMSSKVLPNAALRWRMEDEGCRKEPSRAATIQDETGVTPSPALARRHTREGIPPADAGPHPVPDPAAWTDNAPIGRDAAAGGSR